MKARHIPLILKFMADKKCSLQGRGAPPYNYIWGYEEPENSLELASSVELADQFWDFTSNGISQIFLTTHSPVFYNLCRKPENMDGQISCHHIYCSTQDDGTKEASELSDLDERMGATALFAPVVASLEDKVRRQERARVEVEEMAQANRRKLFVEGPSDKLIVEKALRVFAPAHAGEIDVETRDSAGFNYVIDMLSSWRSRAKYHPELPRAAGLLDLDPDAKKAAKKWNDVPKNVLSAKCFKVPKPPHIIPAFQAGFRVPVVLETLYDRDAWIWADEHGYLEARHIPNVIPPELNNQIIAGETTLNDYLHDDWAIFVKKEFRKCAKMPMSRHFSTKADDEFRARVPWLEQLVLEIEAYLFPET